VVEPVALVALGIKEVGSAGVGRACRWNAVEIEQMQVVKPGQGTRLAVLLDYEGEPGRGVRLVA
jgi:hypothetical protein